MGKKTAILVAGVLLICAASLWAVVGSQITFTLGTTPGNPAAGKVRLWANTGTGNLECLTSAGGSCLSGGGGTPGGSNTQLQYNSSGSFGGISAATTNGTNLQANVIHDLNGNVFLTSSAAASAVDAITVITSSTANPATVAIVPTGSDSNINFTLAGTGTGAVQVDGPGGQTTLKFLQSSTFLIGSFDNAQGFTMWNGRDLNASTDGTGDFTKLNISLNPSFGIQVASGLVIGFNSSANLTGSADTALSRLGAASAALGNGSAGDHTGTLRLGTITIDNSTFSFNGHTCSIVSTVVTCP